MTHQEIRQKFRKFMESKGHRWMDSSSLLPDDPSVLFTTAGMQPIISYLLGERHPNGSRIANSQKCFRAQDIEEVGDNRHTTFFEMLGNWSFGDYWKEEQLPWIFEFLTKHIGLDPKKIYVTVFSGGSGIDKDTDSLEIWQKLFESKNIKAKYGMMDTLEEASRRGMKEDERIFGYGVEKNWWSMSGTPDKMSEGEPGGPDSEMFYRFESVQHDKQYGEFCHPNCDCGQFVEIGNSVFMEFQKLATGDFGKLPERNVDFGGGLERMTAASEDQADIFKTSAFNSILKSIEQESGKKYESDDVKNFRIIADHIKAAVMLIHDGATPSNKTQGYMVRRLIRRAMRYARLLNSEKNVSMLQAAGDQVIEMYSLDNKELIVLELEKEFKRFIGTLESGLKVINGLFKKEDNLDTFALNNSILFDLYQSCGFPVELSLEEINRERGNRRLPAMDNSLMKRYLEMFQELLKEHQVKSRAGVEKKFGGHGLLLDTGELKAADEAELKIVTRLHTATHLLQAALRKILGNRVTQAGSDITAERLRFDFTFARKLTAEELKEIEELVNDVISRDYPVFKETMPQEDARETGALHFSKIKYPENVDVYTVGQDNNWFSKEFCGGPHVEHTGVIGKFKITKEEAVSAGVRRIRATVS